MSGFRPRFFVSPAQLGNSAPTHNGAVPTEDLVGVGVVLDPEDSHHAVRVLRLRPGDECEVVMGTAVHVATVQTAGDKQVELRLGERLEGPEAGAVYQKVVALVQAVPRPAALDWTIEKSTEVGASLIILVHTAGSPGQPGRDARAKHDRWARIAREAAKQSKQPAVPPVEALPSLEAAVERVKGLGLMPAILDPQAGQSLYDLVVGDASVTPATAGAAAVEGATGVALWIGPESGWTVFERDTLVQAGAVPARLGRGVLRTETAGPVAVAVARLALKDW